MKPGSGVSSDVSTKVPDPISPKPLLSSAGQADGPTNGCSAETERDNANQAMNYTFKIFRDWRGLYRWVLTDQSDRRIQASRFGFAALAGAFRDVELQKATQYSTASIYDETGR